jgi:uracil-DNA glycosylase
MRIDAIVNCKKFPCTDVKHECFVVPGIDIDPDRFSTIMISEAAPAESTDYYYAGGNALFERTTVLAFQDAGAEVSSIRDILGLGVYLTTAVKCGKTGYGIDTGTVKECSLLLEKELDLFHNSKVLMLMGDVAIKAINEIARRSGENRVIPVGSTYKIRSGEYRFRDKRVLPSYLQAGPSFFIEKSKRKMIAEDIGKALKLVK